MKSPVSQETDQNYQHLAQIAEIGESKNEDTSKMDDYEKQNYES